MFLGSLLRRKKTHSLKDLTLEPKGRWKQINFRSIWREFGRNHQIAFFILAALIAIPSILEYAPSAVGARPIQAVKSKTVAQLALIENDYGVENYDLSESLVTVDNDYLFQAGGIEIIVSKNNRTDTIEYEVKPGESVASVAQDFGLTADTIRYINGISGNGLKAGQRLMIPPVDGISITVQRNDTLANLARKYSISTENIFKYNPQLKPGEPIFVGMKIFIPGAVVPKSEYRPNSPAPKQLAGAPSVSPHLGGGAFIWPTSNGTRYISQGFGRTKYSSYHTGLDMPLRLNGSPIYASAAGVVHQQYNRGGYGYLTIIDHGNGLETYYAHMSKFAVPNGTRVSQGQLIGYMGNTGRSTGPHLHFEVRKNHTPQNPLSYLPR